jgi:hypothetical protein
VTHPAALSALSVSSVGSRHYIERELRQHAFWRDAAFWAFVLDSEVLTGEFASAKARNEFVLSYLIQVFGLCMSQSIASTRVEYFIHRSYSWQIMTTK